MNVFTALVQQAREPRRTGVQTYGEGESALSWALFRPEVSDDTALGYFGGASYGGPGRVFRSEPNLHRTRTRVLVTQFAGLDI